MVVLQRLENLAERRRRRLDVRLLLGGEVVKVLVDRVSRVDLVLYPVEPGHEERRESQVGIAGGVRTTELEPLRARALGIHRNAHGRAPVALRVDQVHRRLVAGDEPLVAVGARGPEAQERRGVLEEPADVIARRLAQAGVAPLVVEGVGLLLPDRLVHVHARAVVLEERLGHEAGREAGLAADVLDDVLEHHQLVGHAGERVVAHVDLGLPRGGHLVMVHLAFDPDLRHRQHDGAAQVLEAVRRRNREVALLVARPVSEVGSVVLARIPDSLARVDVVVAEVRPLVEPDVVEDVELGFRPPVGDVSEAGRDQVFLRLLRDVARVAREGLERERVLDVADQSQRRHLQQRIDEGGHRIGKDEHVALLDLGEAADARAVEPDPLLEQGLGEPVHRDRVVLPGPRQVDETEIDHLHVVVPGQLDDVLRSHCHTNSPFSRS